AASSCKVIRSRLACVVDDASTDNREQDLPLQATPVEGRILRFGAKRGRIDHNRSSRVEQDEVGGRALRQHAGVQTQQTGGALGQWAEHVQQVQTVLVVQHQGGGQQGLQTHGAGRGLGEGTALVFGGL